jgi:hypothetical protein
MHREHGPGERDKCRNRSERDDHDPIKAKLGTSGRTSTNPRRTIPGVNSRGELTLH